MGQYRINIAAPNLTCICMDQMEDGDFGGRIIHKYSAKPVPFQKVGQMITILDQFFNQINYPQASTKDRSFQKKKKSAAEIPVRREKPPVPVLTLDEVLANKGELATFVLHVQFRQNSSWQGKLMWVEEEKAESFCSVLELLKLLDSALSKQA